MAKFIIFDGNDENLSYRLDEANPKQRTGSYLESPGGCCVAIQLKSEKAGKPLYYKASQLFRSGKYGKTISWVYNFYKLWEKIN